MLHCDMWWNRIFCDDRTIRFVTFVRTRVVRPIHGTSIHGQ